MRSASTACACELQVEASGVTLVQQASITAVYASADNALATQTSPSYICSKSGRLLVFLLSMTKVFPVCGSRVSLCVCSPMRL